MPLNIIYGRNMLEKTQYCIELAAKNLPRPSFIIVPEQFSFTAEKMISQTLGIQGLGGIEILSFKSLARRFLSKMEGAATKKLDQCKKIVLLNRILLKHKNEFASLSKSAFLSGTAEELSEVISEFKRYNIAEEKLFEVAEKMPQNITKAKLLDIAAVYKYYNSELAGHFFDEDDELSLLAELIERYDLLRGTDIYIDHFDGFTPSEEACIQKMMKYNLTVTLGMKAEDCIREEFYTLTKSRDRLLCMAKSHGQKTEFIKYEEGENKKDSPELDYLQNKYFEYPCAKWEGKTQNIKIFTAKNPLDEVTYIAEEIIRLCRLENIKFGDISVVLRGIGEYERYIKAVFPKYNINFFMDRRADILNHACVVSVLSALTVICEGYSYENIFGYIKSGFCPISDREIEILENYVLATGIRGSVWTEKDNWNMRLAIYNENPEPDQKEITMMQEADRIRRIVTEPLVLLHNELKEGKTAKEKCVAVYNFINNINLPAQVKEMAGELEEDGKLSEAGECINVYNRLIDSLDGIAESLESDSISMADFLRVMKSCLATYKAGIIPMSRDSVFVGDVSRVRGYNTKVLFCMGVNDGVFPQGSSKKGILSDAEREQLALLGIELAATSNEKCIEENRLIYKVLDIPKEKIYFTLSGANMEGAALRPSSIIARIKEIFPNVSCKDSLFGMPEKTSSPKEALLYLAGKIRTGWDDEDRRIFGWLLQNPEWSEKAKIMVSYSDYKNHSKPISKENAKKLFGEELTIGVSGIEKFSACPFAYFMQYTLSAKERQKASFAANSAGSFLHNFVDDFSNRIASENISWKDLTEETTDALTDEIFNDFILRTNKYALENSPSCVAIFTRLKAVVKKCIMHISEHMKKGEFEPLGYEISFSDKGRMKPLCITLPTGQKIKLTGRIDRADILKTENGSFIRIIDYKSGKKEFNLSDVANGLNLQLAIYLTALCENEIEDAPAPVKPAAILYYRLTDPVIAAELSDGEDKVKESKLKELKMKGVLLDNKEVVRAMDKTMEKSSDILPVRENASGELGGSLLTEKQFEYMSEHVKYLAGQLSENLLKGRTDISPYKTKDTSACQYCAYKTACGFDLSIPGCHYRHIENLAFSDALTVMRGDKDED